MKIIEYISYLMIPLMFLIIVLAAAREKKDAYNIFLDGAREGLGVITKIFPTMVGILIAINLFKITGAMDILINMLSPITKIFKIPSEIVPLGIMSSISGGASFGLLSDTIKTYGVDSFIGNVAATILGSSETTLYVIAIYVSSVKVKDTRGVIYISLICDIVAVFSAVWIWYII